MAEDEVGHSGICKQMLSLPKIEDRTAETVRSTVTFENSHVEVEKYLNGFCDRVTKDTNGI